MTVYNTHKNGWIPGGHMTQQVPPSDLMYRLLVEGVKDYAIYILDRKGTVLNWNAGAQRAKGYTAEEIVGRNYECFYTSDDRANGLPRLNLDLAYQNGHHSAEGWRVRKDGTTFWARVALDVIHNADGDFLGFAKVTRDLTERMESAALLEHQALHDSLTGLLNRVGIAKRFEACSKQAESGFRVAVHYIDLDHFKPVNDTFGHHVGDEVLREVASRLKSIGGSSGIAGRLGGDEFVILQWGFIDAAAIAAMAKAIVAYLKVPIQIGEKTALIGASVGVSIASEVAPESAILFREADLALYEAKRAGRNGFRFYRPEMHETVLTRNLFEGKLRHAVKAMDFYLVYQPVIDSQTGQPVAFEALLRWTDQTGVPVSPAEFVPIAEELGLMPELGEWVMHTACREAASWPDGLAIAVNVSPTQLKQHGFAGQVTRILAETGLAPERLELEITETAVIGDLVTACQVLTEIRSLGVGVALDDFGTGFSSLSLVHSLPLTRIKIDRSFITDIDKSHRSVAIVEAVTALCRRLNLKATAEGVETKEQSDAIRACGCSQMQGYFYGRPSESSELKSLRRPAPSLVWS